MSYSSIVRAASACIAALVLFVSPTLGDPKPLSKEEQAKVDAAIDKGVAFLKKAQTKNGDFGWKFVDDERWIVGQCALPAYALLESGVPAADPSVQNAAEFLRRPVLLTDSTYDLSLAILFFDRLGDPKDENLIKMCALRLIAGQHRTGGWSYKCPTLNGKNAQDLLKNMNLLAKRMNRGSTTRDAALGGIEIPSALQIITVFQRRNQLAWHEPGKTPDDMGREKNSIILDGRSDNSNTQLALLGLWAANRHGIDLLPVFELSVERFERFHVFPNGYWMYNLDFELSAASRKSMTCSGLIALAIGRGLKLRTPGAVDDEKKDVHVLRGFAALSRRIGKPLSDMKHQHVLEDHYFLWSLERVAMLYNMQTIADKDWYKWGAEILVTNQFKYGWWPAPTISKRAIPRDHGDYKPLINSSFALLFLKRSHPMIELTPKLPLTSEKLNEGIARLRSRDTYPNKIPVSVAPSKDASP